MLYHWSHALNVPSLQRPLKNVHQTLDRRVWLSSFMNVLPIRRVILLLNHVFTQP